MIRSACLGAAAALLLSAASGGAGPEPTARVWLAPAPGIAGTYTVGQGLPQPIPAQWEAVEVPAGTDMVVRRENGWDAGGDGRIGLEEAIHALRTVAGQ